MLPRPDLDHAWACGLRTSDRSALIVGFEMGGHGCERLAPCWIEVSGLGQSADGRCGYHAPFREWLVDRESGIMMGSLPSYLFG